MKNNWLVISIVAALTVATLFFWETPPKLLLPDPVTDEAQRFPYAVLDDAHSRHFDEAGNLSYEFVATKLKHFRRDLNQLNDQDYATLEAPVLTLYTEDLPWYITAKTGTLSDAGELLTLSDNVRIWQENEAQQTTELNTSLLRIYPNEKIVRTDAQVEITSPQGKLEARGMVVDLATKNIKLLERVRGIHEPI